VLFGLAFSPFKNVTTSTKKAAKLIEVKRVNKKKKNAVRERLAHGCFYCQEQEWYVGVELSTLIAIRFYAALYYAAVF
jgi:hypothetical protein